MNNWPLTGTYQGMQKNPDKQTVWLIESIVQEANRPWSENMFFLKDKFT